MARLPFRTVIGSTIDPDFPESWQDAPLLTPPSPGAAPADPSSAGSVFTLSIASASTNDPETTRPMPPVPAPDTTQGYTNQAAGAAEQLGLDYPLAALYLRQLPDASQTVSFWSVYERMAALSADGKSVAVEVVAKDGDNATLLQEMQSIGLQNGDSTASGVQGWLPINQLSALVALPDFGQAQAKGVLAVLSPFGDSSNYPWQSLSDDAQQIVTQIAGDGLDAGLTALYLKQSVYAAETEPFWSSVSQVNADFNFSFVSADGTEVAIQAIAADGNSATMLQELESIGLQDSFSVPAGAGGELPIDQLAALLELPDFGYAAESKQPAVLPDNAVPIQAIMWGPDGPPSDQPSHLQPGVPIQATTWGPDGPPSDGPGHFFGSTNFSEPPVWDDTGTLVFNNPPNSPQPGYSLVFNNPPAQAIAALPADADSPPAYNPPVGHSQSLGDLGPAVNISAGDSSPAYNPPVGQNQTQVEPGPGGNISPGDTPANSPTAPAGSADQGTDPNSALIAAYIETSNLAEGPLHGLDTQLQALYLPQTEWAQSTAAFTSTIVQFGPAITNDGQNVTIDVTSKDGNGATLLQELASIGLIDGSSYGAMAGGSLPISQLGALLGLDDFGHADESVFQTSSVVGQGVLNDPPNTTTYQDTTWVPVLNNPPVRPVYDDSSWIPVLNNPPVRPVYDDTVTMLTSHFGSEHPPVGAVSDSRTTMPTRDVGVTLSADDGADVFQPSHFGSEHPPVGAVSDSRTTMPTRDVGVTLSADDGVDVFQPSHFGSEHPPVGAVSDSRTTMPTRDLGVTLSADGGASSVYLYGAAGNDTLMGGTGNDFLYGEGATNTFAFNTGWGADTIQDWTSGESNLIDHAAPAGSGVHAPSDLTRMITGANDTLTSGHIEIIR